MGGREGGGGWEKREREGEKREKGGRPHLFEHVGLGFTIFFREKKGRLEREA